MLAFEKCRLIGQRETDYGVTRRIMRIGSSNHGVFGPALVPDAGDFRGQQLQDLIEARQGRCPRLAQPAQAGAREIDAVAGGASDGHGGWVPERAQRLNRPLFAIDMCH